MSCFVYILRCKDGSFYTGITSSLFRRIKQHNLRTKSSLQKSKVSVKLVYYKKYSDRIQAAQREKAIKGWNMTKKINLTNSLH